VEKFPENIAYKKSLASAYARVAEALDQQLRFREGVPMQARALELHRHVFAADPPDEETRRVLLEKHFSNASALTGAGQLDRAAEHYEAALQVLRTTDFKELSEQVIKVPGGYGGLLITLGRYDEAEGQLTAARRLAEARLAASADINQKFGREFWLAFVEYHVGFLRLCQGKPDEAEHVLAVAMERFERARAELPEYIWGHHLLGHVSHQHGVALAALDRVDDSIAAHERAAAYWRGRGIPTDLYEAALAQWRMGELYYLQGRVARGDEHLTAALREFNATSARLPDEPFAQERLVVFLCTSPNAAHRDPQRAVLLAEQVSTDSNGPLWRYLGLARHRAGDRAGAEEAIQKGMKLRNGGDAFDWLLLAGTQFASGRHEQASSSFGRAETALARGAPIFHGHIGVIGFQHIRAEVEALMHTQAQRRVP
jgi:tetratricopeptide (TPR) repeat protein